MSGCWNEEATARGTRICIKKGRTTNWRGRRVALDERSSRKTLATNVTRHHHFHEWYTLHSEVERSIGNYGWTHARLLYTRGLDSIHTEKASQKIILVVLRDEKQSRKLFSTMQTLPPQRCVLLHFLSSTKVSVHQIDPTMLYTWNRCYILCLHAGSLFSLLVTITGGYSFSAL